jgi:hypothetical protein
MGSRRVDRRTLLKLGLFGIPATVAVTGGGLAYVWAGADIDTAGKVSFTNRLAVPPLARGRRDGAGRRVFDLRIAPGRHRFRPGRPTATWGVNGAHLGPTLRAGRVRPSCCGCATACPRRRVCTGTACVCPRPWTADRTSRSNLETPGRPAGA